METSYKKLWKQLIDRDMTKTELRMRSGISTMALAKLGKGENVPIEVLKKYALHWNAILVTLWRWFPVIKKVRRVMEPKNDFLH